MNNYKALKSAGSVSVQKVKVVDYPEVFATAEVKYKDGDELPEGKEIGDIKIGEVPGFTGETTLAEFVKVFNDQNIDKSPEEINKQINIIFNDIIENNSDPNIMEDMREFLRDLYGR